MGMREVRDFGKVADFLLPRSFKLHAAVLVISLLMVPGLIASLTPVSYTHLTLPTICSV